MIIRPQLDPATSPQRITDIVRAGQDRLSEDTVKRLAGYGQPLAEPGQLDRVIGHQVQVVHSPRSRTGTAPSRRRNQPLPPSCQKTKGPGGSLPGPGTGHPRHGAGGYDTATKYSNDARQQQE